MGSWEEIDDSVHVPQELQIEVEVHREPTPLQTPKKQTQSSSQSNTGGAQAPEEDNEDKNALLKRELLQSKGKKITRTSSAPDLTWVEEGSCKEHPTLHPTFSQSESIQDEEDEQRQTKKRAHKTSTGLGFTSSCDSGFRDRFSSQEDVDLESVEDRKSWRRSWHGSGSRQIDEEALGDGGISVEEDTEDDQVIIKIRSDDKNDSICEVNNNDSAEICEDDLNTTQKDIVAQTIDKQCVELNSTNTKDQGVTCDLSHDLSPNGLHSSKTVDNVHSAKSQLSVDSGLSVVPTLAAIVENEISHWHSVSSAEKIGAKTQDIVRDDEEEGKHSTTKFNSIPAIEQDVMCVNNSRRIQNLDLPIGDQVHVPSTSSPPADSVQHVFDGKSSSQVETLPKPIAARNPSTECQIKNMPCVDLQPLDARNTQQQREADIPSVTDILSQPAVGEVRSASSNERTQPQRSVVNDEKVEQQTKRSAIKSSSLCHAASDLASYLPATTDGSFAHDQLSQLPVVSRYSTQRHSIPGQQGYVTYGIANEQEQYSPKPTTSLSPSLHSTPVQHRRTKSLEESITASLAVSSEHSEDRDQPHLAVSCSVVDVLVMVQQMVSFVSELCLILCPLPGMKQQVEVGVPGPSGESYSAVLCRDRAVRMRGELLNNITQVR